MVLSKDCFRKKVRSNNSFIATYSKFFCFLSVVTISILIITNLNVIQHNEQSEHPEPPEASIPDERVNHLTSNEVGADGTSETTFLNPKIPTKFIGPTLDASRASPGASTSIRGSGSDLNTQYLIITPEAFLSALEPLVSWKEQKGVYTTSMTLDGPNGIASTYDGPDLEAKIQAFLREYYYSTPNLKWLLLVGDSEIIPPRRILTNVSNESTLPDLVRDCFSDYYYSALETTWDTNNNQIYGEPGEEDWTPELFVGRLPVNNPSEVSTVVNKILTYEKNPPTGDWLLRTIQAGALMDSPNELDDPWTPDVDEGYNSYKDNAYEAILKVRNHIPAEMDTNTFLDYDRMPGGEYSKANDTLNESNVLTAYNLGAQTVNFISKGDDNGVRHYNGNGLGKIEYNSDYFFSYNTAKLASNGYKLPLLYTSSCTSVNFTNTDDTNLEQLIISPYGGAIGVIGATTDTYRLEFYINDSSYGNWWLNVEFWHKFYSGEGDFRPGDILYSLKEDYYKHFTDTANNPHPGGVYESLYRINFFSYNLLGDPEIPIYTNVPHELSVDYDHEFSPIYRKTNLELTVLDNITKKPVSGANVCLKRGNNSFLNQTDSNGLVRFELEVNSSETLNFTVTAHNYYYYSGTVKIIPREDVVIKNDDIQIDRNPIPRGVTVNISINVHNNGSSDISGLKLHCYADKIAPENLITQPIVIDTIQKGEHHKLNFMWSAWDGSHTIIVLADPDDIVFESDEDNNIAETILIENQPPTLDFLPIIYMFEDTPAIDELDLAAIEYTSDPDTDVEDLEFYLVNTSNPDFSITINNSLLSFYPPENWYGNVTVVAGVYDGISHDTDDFIINVTSVNDPPVINETTDWLHNENVSFVANRITVLEDQLVHFTMVGHDPDDNDTGFVFTDDAELFNVHSSTGEVKFIPINSDVGVYEINFTLYDGHEENNQDWKIITLEVINTNDPPELLLSQEVHYLTVDRIFDFTVSGYDRDINDTLRFKDDTDLFEINSVTGQIKFKPKDSQIGRHRVIITVNDGNSSDPKTIVLEIASAPDEPLDAYYVLICPIILIIIIILLVTQEYFKHKKTDDEKKDDNEKNETQEKEKSRKQSRKNKKNENPGKKPAKEID